MSEKPDFFILVTPDSKLLLEEIERIEKKFPPKSGAWSRHTFWADEQNDDRFWKSLNQNGLFATCDSILLRRANEYPASLWKTLSKNLSRASSVIFPFICLEVEYEKRKFKIPAHIQKSGCFLYAQKMGWYWEQPPLSGSFLQKYVEKAIKNYNLTADRKVLTVLCATLPPSAAAIDNEIQKLALMSGDGIITEDLIHSQPFNSENNAFLIINKLQKGSLVDVWQDIAASGQNSLLFYLTALLSRELRILWQLIEGERPSINPREINCKKSLAFKLGKKNLAKGFSILADAEWQIKSGRQTPEQTLEFLAVQINALFTAAKQDSIICNKHNSSCKKFSTA